MKKYLELVRNFCTPEFLGLILFSFMYEVSNNLYSDILYGGLALACAIAVIIEMILSIKGEIE